MAQGARYLIRLIIQFMEKQGFVWSMPWKGKHKFEYARLLPSVSENYKKFTKSILIPQCGTNRVRHF
jgi:hypothetical protein